MKREIRTTADGSTTIYIPEMDENYHSSHGAIQEAEHVFIQHGLSHLDQPKIRVFEMGFGTGLNALLALRESEKRNITIDYAGIEAFPVEPELLANLNYFETLDLQLESYFESMHQCAWEEQVAISERFGLEKIQQKIEDFDVDAYLMNHQKFDLIFYDAFGPRAQSVMWEEVVLRKMQLLLKNGGMLVSYCAQGQFKRNLKALGFVLESLPGPPGKREMTRATLKMDC